eukprot:gene22305-biopygen5733
MPGTPGVMECARAFAGRKTWTIACTEATGQYGWVSLAPDSLIPSAIFYIADDMADDFHDSGANETQPYSTAICYVHRLSYSVKESGPALSKEAPATDGGGPEPAACLTCAPKAPQRRPGGRRHGSSAGDRSQRAANRNAPARPRTRPGGASKRLAAALLCPAQHPHGGCVRATRKLPQSCPVCHPLDARWKAA